MTAYVAIADSEIDPESPGTTTLFTKLRNNPIAIAEGSSGAPAVVDAALDTTVTSAGITWVSNRLGGVTAGGVGTYLFAQGSTSDVTFGSTIAGSSLTPVGAMRSINVNILTLSMSFLGGGTISGTWRCMGYYDYTRSVTNGNMLGATLWLRIS